MGYSEGGEGMVLDVDAKLAEIANERGIKIGLMVTWKSRFRRIERRGKEVAFYGDVSNKGSVGATMEVDEFDKNGEPIKKRYSVPLRRLKVEAGGDDSDE